MISLNQVEKVYRAGAEATYVLRQVSLDVREGEFVTVMGTSGAGKCGRPLPPGGANRYLQL